MTIKLLVDMNLSPEWVPLLTREGWETIHWSAVGDPRAPDTVIMTWARSWLHLFTHDLDFGAALALTHAAGPSVLQLRRQKVLPEDIGPLVLATFRQYEQELAAGALLVVEERRSRIRDAGRGASP
jgi:predicted nuclease of predicted toxin-antitoxin system